MIIDNVVEYNTIMKFSLELTFLIIYEWKQKLVQYNTIMKFSLELTFLIIYEWKQKLEQDTDKFKRFNTLFVFVFLAHPDSYMGGLPESAVVISYCCR